MTRAIVTFSEPFRALVTLELARQQARIAESLAPGVAIIHTHEPFDQLAERWRARPPVYIRHVVPLQLRTPRKDLKHAIRKLAQHLPYLPTAVQLRTLSLTPESLRRAREADAEAFLSRLKRATDPRRPAQVIHLVETESELLAGAAPVRWTLSPYSGGAPTYPQCHLNRAEWKLMEALETFRLTPGKTALDLGASPGGWSRILLQYGSRVTAVDPHPRGMHLTHPNLAYHAITAQEYLEQTQARYDLITCDAYLPPKTAAHLMNQAAEHLEPTGSAILNLKLKNPKRHHQLVQALKILRERYRIPRLRQLHYNRSEVTAWLMAKGAQHEEGAGG